jgi:hypothetical protein
LPELLNVASDNYRRDLVQLHVAFSAEAAERGHRVRVGFPDVTIPNVRREELDEPGRARSLASAMSAGTVYRLSLGAS